MNTKAGLDYFPFDIDFYQDEKIQFLSARFGLKGEAIIVRLLCKIYRNGYYTKWDDDTALLFAKGVGDSTSDSCVKDIVHELVKRGFFDKNIFDRFGILTSRGIQKRFIKASSRRKSVEITDVLLLVDLSEYQNVNITTQNVDIKAQNVDILKQSKVKESKVKKRKEHNALAREGDIFINRSFSPKMQENLTNWLKYKKERRQDYKPTGLTAFLTLVENKLKIYNEADIITAIDESMASNYQGIVWSKLKQDKLTGNRTALERSIDNYDHLAIDPFMNEKTRAKRERASYERPTENYDHLAIDPFEGEKKQEGGDG